MRRVSKAHARGHFAKKLYGLQRKPFSPGRTPEKRHSSRWYEMSHGGIMEVRTDKVHWGNDKMTEDVVISMRGLQFEQSDIDAEQVETITIGKYSVEEKTGHHHVEFDEILEGFDGPAQSLLRFRPGFLELTRTGFINVHMVFQENRKNLTNYVTPYGEILIGIDAKKIHITQKPDKITVNVEYALEVNYEYLSDCRIVINISSKDTGDSLLSY